MKLRGERMHGESGVRSAVLVPVAAALGIALACCSSHDAHLADATSHSCGNAACPVDCGICATGDASADVGDASSLADASLLDAAPVDAPSNTGLMAPGHVGWIILNHSIIDIVKNGGSSAPSLAKAYFGQAATYDIMNSYLSPYYAGVTQARDFKSVSDGVGLATTLDSGCGALSTNVHAVTLDLESWSYTPSSEQKDPVAAYATAAKAIAGFNANCRSSTDRITFVCTPGTDLVASVGGCPSGTDQPHCFIDLKLASGIAKSCDVYEIQAQGVEMKSEFGWYVGAAANQVRSVGPAEVIYAGIAASPTRLTDCSAATLFDDVSTTIGTVSGYWLNEFSSAPCGGVPEAVISAKLLALMKAAP